MGSITPYSTAGGKRYLVNYRKPDRTQTVKRGFRTKREAELFLAVTEVKIATGEFIEARAARATISVLGAQWLRAQTHLKPSYSRTIEMSWRLHVEPVFGSRPISQVSHSEVQVWVSNLTASMSATSVLRAYGILAGIFDVAVKDRRIPSNPARGVNLPRKVGKKRAYLTHSQVRLLAEEARAQSTLVYFLAYTGLRWGEAVGLKVGQVDFPRRRVNVTENAVRVDGVFHVGTPKTHSARSVPFPEFLDDGLRALSEGKTRDQIVFGNGVSYIIRPDQRKGWFVGALKRSRARDHDMPLITIHDLRHTAASLAISAGANVKAVQRMLGHASAAMTLDTYADLFDDDLDAVGAALNQAKINSDVVKMLSNDQNEA
jgi:integrase